MKSFKVGFCIIFLLIINISFGYTTQRTTNSLNNNQQKQYQQHQNSNNKNNNNNDVDDDSNPLLDMASMLLQQTLSNQGNNNNGNANIGMANVLSLVGNLMNSANNGNGDSKSFNNVGGTAQILAGLGSLLSNSNIGNNHARSGDNGGGFDPALIGNVIEMFVSSNSVDSSSSSSSSSSSTSSSSSSDTNRQKRNSNNNNDSNNIGLDSILQIATNIMNQNGNDNSINNNNNNDNDNLMSLLPMVMQVIGSFNGPEGQRTQEKHKDHAWVLPPLLENFHVMWDHFSQSQLAETLWQKSGINTIFKGFTDRKGKLDYDRLFESLHNQSFRRRWIKAATLYLADWANYFAEPKVYQNYLNTGVVLFNGFLKSQGFPSNTFLDLSRSTETLTNLFNYVAIKFTNIKIDSSQYVEPAVKYAKEILKLGQARGLLQKFNASEISDKLTDTLNLEVIEPILKVHRAYRYAIDAPHCDKYVLCQVNSHDPNEQLGLAGFKPAITKFGSMTAALFLSLQHGAPFWSLIATVNEPYDCEIRFPVDCSGFIEGEAKVTTEYIHNEL